MTSYLRASALLSDLCVKYFWPAEFSLPSQFGLFLARRLQELRRAGSGGGGGFYFFRFLGFAIAFLLAFGHVGLPGKSLGPKRA